MKWISSKQAAELGKSLAAIVLALVIGALFILVAGESPATAYSSLLKGALGTPQAVANTVSKSIPLAFTGLAVALGSRCGMLNIGAEGQLHAGAMGSYTDRSDTEFPSGADSFGCKYRSRYCSRNVSRKCAGYL